MPLGIEQFIEDFDLFCFVVYHLAVVGSWLVNLIENKLIVVPKINKI